MRLGRAQAIIIRDNKVLFGYGNIGGKLRHCFIGGGIEEGETPEKAVLREVWEEAGVKGKIVLKLKSESLNNHNTFLVDIGEQKCSLGYDPEEIGYEQSELALQKLVWIPLNEKEKFTQIDINHFKLLIDECNERNFYPEWFISVKQLVESGR